MLGDETFISSLQYCKSTKRVMISNNQTRTTSMNITYFIKATMETTRRKGEANGERISFDACSASPRSTIHAFGPASNKAKGRKVSFEASDKLVQVFPASSMKLNEEDVAELWYTKEEFNLSRKSQMFIVKLMERGMSSLDDDEELCPRGLEARTRAGTRRKNNIIEAGWDAVLGEQEKQWQDGRFSAWSLARTYFESAAASSMDAYLMAKRDAQYVQNMRNRES